MFCRKSKGLGLLVLVAALVVITGVAGCTSEKQTVRVLCAGSLMVPFQEMEREFEKLHPDVDVLIEGHGSIQVIRHVTELYEKADVMVVADYSLLPMMMYNTTMPGTTEAYADWHLKFATNNLGLAYTPESRYASEINSENWHEILSRPEVKLGLSDPRLDSCGYRSLMVCQLAELYYDDQEIFENLITSNFETPVTASENDGSHVISVPEVLEPNTGRIALRGSSVRLLFLLDSGDVDYAFQYQSVAEQHGLQYLELPSEINLGSRESEYANRYENVTVKLDFQRFKSITPEFTGQPIVYGMTIPKNAPHPEIAIQFIKFVTGTQGQLVLSTNKQPAIIPPETDDFSKIPEAIKPML